MSLPLQRTATLALLLLGSLVSASAAETPLPDAIAAPGEAAVLSVHAEGAQVYECKAGAFRSAPYSAEYVFLRKG